MKKCCTCKLEKDDSEFNKNKSRADGLNSICKECSRKRSREYYKEHPDYHKTEVMKRTTKQRKLAQGFILKHFEKNHCFDCGNSDVRVLEFDHLPEFQKKCDIGKMVALGYSINNIAQEIQKCQVVCANCHRIRTVERSKTHYRKSVRSSYG